MSEFSAEVAPPKVASRRMAVTRSFRTGATNHEPVGIWDRRREEWLRRSLERLNAERPLEDRVIV